MSQTLLLALALTIAACVVAIIVLLLRPKAPAVDLAAEGRLGGAVVGDHDLLHDSGRRLG